MKLSDKDLKKINTHFAMYHNASENYSKLKILLEIFDEEKTVTEISENTNLLKQNISQYLLECVNERLIIRNEIRHKQVFYSLTEKCKKELLFFIENFLK